MAGMALKEKALNMSQNEPVPFNSLPTINTMPVVISIKMNPIIGTKMIKMRKI